MLYYILFWMFKGFIIHFCIIFGTNQLTGGPAQIAVFLPISVFRRKRISNGMKPSGTWYLEQTWSRGLGVDVKKRMRSLRGRGRALPLVGPSWLNRPTSSSYIYLRTPKHHGSQRKHNSSAVTLCIHEIPSWSLRRHSARGGIDHGGLLHQHHSPSDELWVVYHRPSSP